MAITVYVPPDAERLSDSRDYTNRFEIHSETSNRVYLIAQHKTKRYWTCSCPRWITKRECKHLRTLALPEHCQPYEAKLNK